MSLDAIKKVNETEQLVQQKRTEAMAFSKKLIADAEREGRELLENSQNKTAVEVKRLMTEAEQKAAISASEVIAQTERACDALHAQAKGRLEKAAALIVERVVNN